MTTVLPDYDAAIAALNASRKSQKLRLVDLAERMGDDTHVHVSRWLSGDREVFGRRLFALAHALGYDLALIPREDT